MKLNPIFEEHLKLLLDGKYINYFKIQQLIEEELQRQYEHGYMDRIIEEDNFRGR